jgi:hypothetical protein
MTIEIKLIRGKEMFNKSRWTRSGISSFMTYVCCSIVGLGLLYMAILQPNIANSNCARVEPSKFKCELYSSGLLGIYKTDISSEQIQSTEIEETCNKGCGYTVFIKTAKEKIYLSYHRYANRSDAQESKDRIDAFIRDRNQETLIIEKDDRWLIIFTIFHLGLFIFTIRVALTKRW